jgi:CDP-diacylglycerol--glycerol-3-phosphate 3-phosphatidyltransferase
MVFMRRGDKLNIIDRARNLAGRLVDPFCQILAYTKVSPNILSIIGFLFAIAACITIALGHLVYGGCLVIMSGAFDSFDGAFARKFGLETRFGAFFDSFIDRYSEAAILFGILYYATIGQEHTLILLTFVSFVGSVMVSYSRVLAEGLGIPCGIGIGDRAARVTVLILMLLLEELLIGLAILAILSNMTALLRVYHVYVQTKG